MIKRDATYSAIIGPEEFNRINTTEHLYIKSSDIIIKKCIEEEVKNTFKKLEVVELGCGPARLTQLICEIKRIKLTGIDHDDPYLAYAQEKVRSDTDFKKADITTYQHDKPVDVFYSQGVHHHMAKPPTEYLRNVRKQLITKGVYIVGDEFLPEYKTEEERRLRATIWYSHIIDHALRHGHEYLAQEEAKTFLDELNTAQDETRVKTKDQIELVLQQVGRVDRAARKEGIEKAEKYALDFLGALEKVYNWKLQVDATLNLSRGDYKICDRIFREEVKETGFRVRTYKSIGLMERIGGMGVYVLEKA